ncbi:hypothetical protein FCULG_00003172 [Fusarium culmorum]|uniref:N-acetyltransferase domain-containing protein n=1 Tax=Fusarium culmorum TaxID=5516 RepID=A0A2T4H6J4_FUSCU|nr:hypothetical protein FCULG_00003172 [Fusarium culmorum]
MSQATLRTDRLELRPLGPEHGDYIYQLDSDPQVMKYIGYGKPLSADDSAIVHKLLLETASFGSGLGCWAGFAGENFPEQRYSPEVNKKRVEFGLRILPKFWGQGYAKEGSRAVVKHGLEDLNVEEVFGETMAVNQGSRAIMEKIGLKHVRTFYNKYDTPPPGIEEGEVEYRVTRDEWSSQQVCAA